MVEIGKIYKYYSQVYEEYQLIRVIDMNTADNSTDFPYSVEMYGSDTYWETQFSGRATLYEQSAEVWSLAVMKGYYDG